MKSSIWLQIIVIGALLTLPIDCLNATFVRCQRTRPFPPCSDCTKDTQAAVLTTCGENPRLFSIKPTSSLNQTSQPTDPSYVLVSNGFHFPAMGLGNLLSAYFTAEALATLAGIEGRIPALHYQGLVFNFSTPAKPEDTRYLRLKELEYYCQKCPLGTTYLNECAGLFTAAPIRARLNYVIEPLRPYCRYPDIIIQFRCEGHKMSPMGLLPFDYYQLALERHVNSSSYVLIIHDPSATTYSNSEPNRLACCTTILHALKEAIAFTFQCDVQVRGPGTIGEDLWMFTRARVFVGAASTLGLYAAIATHGVAYLPEAKALFNNTRPCFRKVRWIQTKRNQVACQYQPLWEWFVPHHNTLLAAHLKKKFFWLI